MTTERIQIALNADGSFRGAAAYDAAGFPVPLSAEALEAALPQAALLVQIEAMRGALRDAEAARAAADEERVSAERDRDEKVATAEAHANAEAAKVAALEARIAELTAPPADPEISDRQMFQQLAIEGEITEDEAEAAVATGTIPDAMMALVQSLPAEQQFGARMMLKGATTIKRRHPMTGLIGQLYSWDDAELDRFFAAAGVL